jgi:cysteine synthase
MFGRPHISEVDADLTVVDLAQATTPLPLYPDRCLALLGESRGIEDEDAAKEAAALAATQAARCQQQAQQAVTKGVSLADSISKGLVSDKLKPVLTNIDNLFRQSAPRSLDAAQQLIRKAAIQAGHSSEGSLVSESATQKVFENPGGVVTTIKSTGEVIVERGGQVLLHLIPGQ